MNGFETRVALLGLRGFESIVETVVPFSLNGSKVRLVPVRLEFDWVLFVVNGLNP